MHYNKYYIYTYIKINSTYQNIRITLYILFKVYFGKK